MIDGVAYLTNGLCAPGKPLDAVSYFTLGLWAPSAGGAFDDDLRAAILEDDRRVVELVREFLTAAGFRAR